MIRRDEGDHWLLISQVDHAHLAAEIAEVWGNSSTPRLPLPHLLVPAIRDHDAGWWEWETAPDVEPKSGAPRDFLEMPMETATEIWTRSINICASGTPSHAEALRRCQAALEITGGEPTHQEAFLLDLVLEHRGPFRAEETTRAAESRQPGAVTETEVRETLEDLTLAGVLETVDSQLAGQRYAPALPLQGHSPLGGIWVSRHFCWLAEKALENRDDPQDLASARRFLNEQRALQEQWTNQALQEFAGEELPRLLETGYRYVQFFDRISLWLCMAEQAEPQEFALPGGGKWRLAPRANGTIEVRPWPLAISEATVSSLSRLARCAPTDSMRPAEVAQGEFLPISWLLHP